MEIHVLIAQKLLSNFKAQGNRINTYAQKTRIRVKEVRKFRNYPLIIIVFFSSWKIIVNSTM